MKVGKRTQTKQKYPITIKKKKRVRGEILTIELRQAKMIFSQPTVN